MGRGQRVLAVVRMVGEQALDIVFPPHCTACGTEGRWVCECCERSVQRCANNQCPVCGKPFWRGIPCRTCQHASSLSQSIAAVRYSDARAMRMVHALKYSFVTKSAPALAVLMATAWICAGGRDNFLCIPVPLHERRMKERGFNQAALLAQECSGILGYKYSDAILVRARETRPQTELARRHRYTNIRDAFLCIDPKRVRNANILLIDDVFTTGATLQEAARVLRGYGARDVRSLTFAHG